MDGDKRSSEKIKSDKSSEKMIQVSDNISGFEVEVPGGHHDWVSESGISEETPLLSGSGSVKSPTPRPGSGGSGAPADRYRRVWVVFYMLGMTTLLPWNFFIAVNDYWNYKFRDVAHNSSHNQLQKEFTSYSGTVLQCYFTLCCLCCLHIHQDQLIFSNIF